MEGEGDGVERESRERRESWKREVVRWESRLTRRVEDRRTDIAQQMFPRSSPVNEIWDSSIVGPTSFVVLWKPSAFTARYRSALLAFARMRHRSYGCQHKVNRE